MLWLLDSLAYALEVGSTALSAMTMNNRHTLEVTPCVFSSGEPEILKLGNVDFHTARRGLGCLHIATTFTLDKLLELRVCGWVSASPLLYHTVQLCFAVSASCGLALPLAVAGPAECSSLHFLSICQSPKR